MRFTYVENRMPVPNITVLAAWTNSDECYVVPSTWNGENWVSSTWNWNGRTWRIGSYNYSGFVRRSTGYPWHSNFRDSRRSGFRVYAWAPWPGVPELPPEEKSDAELVIRIREVLAYVVAYMDEEGKKGARTIVWGQSWKRVRKTLVGLRNEIDDVLSA